jgi:hypothetical protein
MAWIAPKTNWTPPMGVADADLNRIEGNILDLKTTYTGADVLAKIKTVDGVGSGLDADLIQGKNVAQNTGAQTGNHANAVNGAWTLNWKNFADHQVFDASAGTSPSGSAINAVNAATAWSTSYPSLMGWNGQTTYGVRVDKARDADTVANGQTPWHNGNSPALIAGKGWQKFASGLVMQWGEVSVVNGGTVTYPIAFPITTSALILTALNNPALVIGHNGGNPTVFTVYHGNGATATLVNYIAFGR